MIAHKSTGDAATKAGPLTDGPRCGNSPKTVFVPAPIRVENRWRHMLSTRTPRVAARLTNGSKWCKTALLSVVFAAGTCDAADLRTPAQTLRDCVAQAQGAAAVAACEKTQQAALQARIKRWTLAIRDRLQGPDRVAFDRSTRAWQAFFDSELAMLELTLKARRDGLGGSLYPGAVTRLYEERARQLREHLHNLSYVGRSAPSRP